MIYVIEWSGYNLTEGVDWKAERLNAISKRLSGRLCEKVDVLDLVSHGVLSLIVESLGTGTGSEPRVASKLVGALEPVGALWTYCQSLLEICRDLRLTIWSIRTVGACYVSDEFTLGKLEVVFWSALSEGLLIAGKEGMVCVFKLCTDGLFVTPPNRVPSNLVSGDVTSLNISSTEHKEQPLRRQLVELRLLRLDMDTKFA
ncbi:hypothetical protein Tco_0723968 [Tanacetum coccineum]